jgi:hypothetical protein
MHPIEKPVPPQEPSMNTFQPLRLPTRSSRAQRAAALALVILVNAGIAGFIDRLAGAGPAPGEMAGAKPAAAARA